MRQLTLVFSVVALVTSLSQLAQATKEGLPGRRTGGGTRFSQAQQQTNTKVSQRFHALAFASRTNLPTALRVRVIYS
jgi:hypothetical protein